MLVAHQRHAPMSRALSIALIALVRRAAARPQWRNYQFREEMEGDALVALVAECWRYDRERGSARAFVEMVIRTQFGRRVQKEKREYRNRLLTALDRNLALSDGELAWLQGQQ